VPELPEVETTRRGIAPLLTGKTLVQIHSYQASLRWPVPVDQLETLAGQTLLTITRRGKYLLFQFPTGYLLAHLGMSGSMRITEQAEPPAAHDHLDLDFSGTLRLRYTDPRRFGCWLWAGEQPETHPLLSKLGPEPLSAEFTGGYLYTCTRGRKGNIKALIMNSQIVTGVGNIYANEALFMAGIRPNRAAGRLSRQRCQQLASAIRSVLESAIKQGGTTLRDFTGSDGKPGYFAQQLQVYGRGGQPCRNCQHVLTEIRQNQRTTVFCKLCQT
jgi:formamidopyrimidine-DNA glycosylase